MSSVDSELKDYNSKNETQIDTCRVVLKRLSKRLSSKTSLNTEKADKFIAKKSTVRTLRKRTREDHDSSEDEIEQSVNSRKSDSLKNKNKVKSAKKLKAQDTTTGRNGKASADQSSDDAENEFLSSAGSDDDSSDPDYPGFFLDEKEPKDRSCPGCGEDFKSMNELSEHTCSKKPSKGFLCPTCGKIYVLRSTFVTHVQRHTNNTKKTRKCACGSVFYSSQELFEHRCEDKRKRGFQCSVCDKYFKLLSTYINHTRTHSRKKNLKCLACSYKTRHLTSYLAHRQSCCPDELPFVCDVGACEKSFKSKKEVNRHKSVVHKSFRCRYCDEFFKNDITLETHKKKEHS